MNSFLLDTDACIEIIRGNPAPLDAWPDASFVISTVTQFEILSGLRGRANTKREKRARAFLEVADLREFDQPAAEAAAKVRIFLENKGQRIGAYDLMLAGHALALKAPLLTGNKKEFNRVPELTVRSW